MQGICMQTSCDRRYAERAAQIEHASQYAKKTSAVGQTAEAIDPAEGQVPQNRRSTKTLLWDTITRLGLQGACEF